MAHMYKAVICKTNYLSMNKLIPHNDWLLCDINGAIKLNN